MDPNSRNNMIGESTQTNQTSVFGYDSYPPPYVNWNQSDVFPSQFQSGINQQSEICMQNPAILPFSTLSIPEQQMGISNMAPQFTITTLPQEQVNFSFGTLRPTQDVVQFPFQLVNNGFGLQTMHTIRCKRKTDSPPAQPLKQHITEEKMAEHMSKLHINSETITSLKESEADRTQRLYMCEEMRKLQTESILPPSLIAQIQRPCTALVLWKPPTKILPLVNNDVDENENNNEPQQPDNKIIVNEYGMENGVNKMDMDNC